MTWLQSRRTSVRLLFSVLAGIVSLRASELPRKFEDLLRDQIGFTAGQLQRVHRGTVLARVLSETTREEVAVAGLIYARVPWDFVLHEVEDIENFKKGSEVLQIRKFRQPPQEQDIRYLSMPSADLAALSKCRPGDCGVKISSDMMKKIAVQRGQTESNVNSLFQTVFFQYFTDYLNRGRDALITYQDKQPAVSLASATSSIAQQFSWLRYYSPGVWRSLQDQSPTEHATPELNGFYYWSKEKLALKPVVSLTQTSVWHSSDQQPQMAVILSRQLYASHYFEGSIGLTIVFQDPSSAGRGAWIVYVNRSRVDAFGGWFGGAKRAMVNARLPAGLRKNLTQIRTKLEGRYQAVHR